MTTDLYSLANNKCSFCYIYLLLFSLVFVSGTGAQTSAPAQMLPKDFDSYVLETSKSGGKDIKKIQAVADVLVQRFEQGKYTTDDSVVRVINLYEAYELDSTRETKQNGKLRSPQSLALVNRILPLIYKRDALEAVLHRMAAKYYYADNKPTEEAKELEKCHQILTSLNIDIDKARADSANTLAGLYASSGKNTQADSLYFEVLQYPWPQLYADAEAMNYMRQQYVTAGKSLIYLRSKNPDALKDLYFYTSVEAELGPLRDEFLNTAEKAKADRIKQLEEAAARDKANREGKTDK